MKLIYVNRIATHSDILQKPENDPVDIVFRCFRRAYPIDMLKKYRLLMSRYFCVQSSSDSRSASRPITVITPRTTLVTSMKSPSSLSTHTAVRQSSRERVQGRTAFLRFLPRSSRNPRVPALHQRLRRMLSPR